MEGKQKGFKGNKGKSVEVEGKVVEDEGRALVMLASGINALLKQYVA